MSPGFGDFLRCVPAWLSAHYVYSMHRSQRHFVFLIVFCGALPLWNAPSGAAIIAFDDFETYTVGNLNGANGGSGWNSAYVANNVVDVVSGGLSYVNGAINIQGGSKAAAVVIGSPAVSGDNMLNRAFAAQSDTLYMSFLFRPTAGLDSNDFIQFLLNDDTDQNNAGSIGMRNSVGNPFFARTRGSSSDSTQNSSDTTATAQGETYLLVGKLSKAATNYNRMELFVNPTSLTDPGTASAAITLDTAVDAMSYFTIRTATLETGDQLTFDALRIGTTYADVVSPLAAVPEPSSLLLAGLGTMAWAARRKLKRRKNSAVSIVGG